MLSHEIVLLNFMGSIPNRNRKPISWRFCPRQTDPRTPGIIAEAVGESDFGGQTLEWFVAEFARIQAVTA